MVDWKASAWDDENAAIFAIRDMDGDLATLDDTELWMVRQVAGVWQVPVRLTENAVADEAPTGRFIAADTLAVGWRRGDTVVGVFDVGAFDPIADEPELWFTADSGVAAAWDSAQLDYDMNAGLLVAWWSDGGSIAGAMQATTPGNAWASVRVDRTTAQNPPGLISHFHFQQGTGAYAAVVQRSGTTPLPQAKPDAMPAKLLTGGFFPSATDGSRFWAYSSIDQAEIQPLGGSATFWLGGGGTAALNYQWYTDDGPLAGATGPGLQLQDISDSDHGIYSVDVTDADGNLVAGAYFVLRMFSNDFAGYMLRHGAVGAKSGPDEDFDGDGASNLEEFASGTNPADASDQPATRMVLLPGEGSILVRVDTNPDAEGISIVGEVSGDLQQWHDLSWFIAPENRPDMARPLFLLPTTDEDNDLGKFISTNFGIDVNRHLFLRRGFRLTEQP